MTLRPQIKICGARRERDVEAARRAGANFVGLNFVDGRRRAISIPVGRNLAAACDDGPTPVGVFLDATPETVLTTAQQAGLTWVQLHGAESPEYCRRIQSAGLSVIKALAVTGSFDATVAAQFSDCVDWLLLDGPRAGSGTAFDWNRLRGFQTDRPYFIAGGLNHENVAQAAAVAGPAGVDTASGVETDGQIDPDKVLAFCRAAREGAKR